MSPDEPVQHDPPDPVPPEAELRAEGATPIHTRISDLFRAKIESGEWPPHYKLRAEPDLAAELQVSRGTLRRALRTLIDEGRLSRTHGRGTFVNASEPEPPIAQEMLSLSEALAQQGLPLKIDLIDTASGPPPEHVRGLLDLSENASTFRLTRRYLVHDQPIAYLVNHVRADLCAGIDRIDFAHKSLFGVLEGEYALALAAARRTFAAQGVNPTVAKALGTLPGAPVLYLEQVTYLADGRPVEYSDVWIRGDRLKLSSFLIRETTAMPEVEPNG